MNPEIFKEIENMSADDKKALLGTQFPEELEKQAEAELDATLLADALYNYGWLQAQRAIAETDGLDKVAAEDLAAHEQAEKEVGEQIEACLSSLQTATTEDPIEFHKEAQVAAALIFDGFSDCVDALCMDKEAAADGMVHAAKKMALGGLHKMRAVAKAGGHKAAVMGRRHLRKGISMAKKHKGALAVGAGAGMAAGAAAHKMMSKKSSELTVEELLDLTLEKHAMVDSIAEGIEKLASKGEKKGMKFQEKHSKSSKSSKSS